MSQPPSTPVSETIRRLLSSASSGGQGIPVVIAFGAQPGKTAFLTFDDVTGLPSIDLGPVGGSIGEVPAGSVDGQNQTFTLANAPAPPTSLALYLNGLRLSVPGDYSLSGNTVTMVIAPPPNANLVADYQY